MRTFLDEGTITFDGDFYTYAGLFTFARPVQERVPLIFMHGPKSFQAAGELSDGCHRALSYSKEAYEYLVENVKAGAERAGRDWKELDIGAWCVIVCAPDSEEAKRTARTMVAFYISSMPHEQLERHGIDPADRAPIVEALGKGELDRAFELTTPEVAEKLSIAGSPEECVAKITEIASTGVNHMILCVTDPAIVKAFTGKDVSVPDVKGQLRLVHDEVMPSFAQWEAWRVPQPTLGRPTTPALLATEPPSVRPVMLLTFDVPFDRAAAVFAVESAAETGAELYVCHGIPVSVGNPLVPASRTFGSSETREATDAIAQEARDRGVRTTQLLFHHPRPVHAALEVTRDEGVGLLVFGSDRARMGRLTFWRIARRLRKSAPCLVWIAE